MLGLSVKSAEVQDLWTKPPQELCPPPRDKLASVQISTEGANSLMGAEAWAANPAGEIHQAREVIVLEDKWITCEGAKHKL